MSWQGRLQLTPQALLYAGPGSRAERHAHHAVQVVLGPDEALRVNTTHKERRRIVLVAPGVEHALDASGTDMVLLPFESLSNVQCRHTDLHALDLELGSVDVVVAANVLHDPGEARRLAPGWRCWRGGDWRSRAPQTNWTGPSEPVCESLRESDVPTVMTPLLRGTLLAALAAAAFGATTPFLKRYGEGLGPFSTSCLLYAGAALASLGRTEGQSPLQARHLPRLALVAFFGALLAPASLAWGLQRTDAASASLLLNFEAIFTVALSWALYREPLGRRVLAAALSMLAGGLLLAQGAGDHQARGMTGLVAVLGATLGWAADNAMTRPLAELDPRQVVRAKATLGAALSLVAALVGREPRPAWEPGVALLLIGATGYGLSLRLYLRAQRVLGAARTGSVFALAPFVGAVVALSLVGSEGLARLALAGGCFLAGVWLHATEVHNHPHRHPAQEHEHPHLHDDGHHGHPHDPLYLGEHSHVHQHAPIEHEHAHGGDAHHTHEHSLLFGEPFLPHLPSMARHEISLPG